MMMTICNDKRRFLLAFYDLFTRSLTHTYTLIHTRQAYMPTLAHTHTHAHTLSSSTRLQIVTGKAKSSSSCQSLPPPHHSAPHAFPAIILSHSVALGNALHSVFSLNPHSSTLKLSHFTALPLSPHTHTDFCRQTAADCDAVAVVQKRERERERETAVCLCVSVCLSDCLSVCLLVCVHVSLLSVCLTKTAMFN